MMKEIVRVPRSLLWRGRRRGLLAEKKRPHLLVRPLSIFTGLALLVRVLVSGAAVLVSVLAVVVGRGGVLSAFFMIAVIMMVSCLSMMMRGRFVVRGGIVMVLAGHVLLFSCHWLFLPWCLE
jgi:hypothetical protein